MQMGVSNGMGVDACSREASGGVFPRQATLFDHDLRVGQATFARGGMQQIIVSAGDPSPLDSLPNKKRRNREATTIRERDSAIFTVYCDGLYFLFCRG